MMPFPTGSPFPTMTTALAPQEPLGRRTGLGVPRPELPEDAKPADQVVFIEPESEPDKPVSTTADAIKAAQKAATSSPVKVEVVAPYRVCVEGKPYVGGDTLELPADKANTWTKAGWVTPVAQKGKR